MKKALSFCHHGAWENVYGAQERRALAGAFNGECRRLGAALVDELRRYLKGEPLQWEIRKEQTTVMA